MQEDYGQLKIMKKDDEIRKVQHPDRIGSYFKLEIVPLLIVTISGLIYNVGLTAGPYFEGQLAQRLLEIMTGRKEWPDMVKLAVVYLIVILVVQGARCLKRFYVRRFANDTSRNMRHMLYNSLVHKSKTELERESVGAIMTKAVADVDACAEGMRKFTTEIFDTGVVLLAYGCMLLLYDWRLALISCLFIPAAYQIAAKLKKTVTRYNADYKKCAGRLSDATMDRVTGAITYRVYGRETARNEAYDRQLTEYEKCAVYSNVWETSMKPMYQIISMCGVVPLLYFGAKNVLGTGWCSWDIAAFTTFLSCFTKMAVKSSSAAKLFNSVQKASVSWKRIKPLMQEYIEPDTKTSMDLTIKSVLSVSHVSFAYPEGEKLIHDLSFEAVPGQIIGITGPVASGKSTLGKLFLCENPYEGNIRIDDCELSEMSAYERSQLISYMGHQPELMSDTIEENIRLGGKDAVSSYLKMTEFDAETEDMADGIHTCVGSSGVRLSGGQQARAALARTLYNGKHVLILDDPFSAVDKQTEARIMEQLRDYAKEKIVLLISHRLDLFPAFDQVIWLDEDTESVGNHEQFMRDNPFYAQLYCAQMSGGDLDEE